MNTQSQNTTSAMKINKKWQNLPGSLCNYATQLMEYLQKKEYNNESSEDFMTYQMLYLKLQDIYKNFTENKVLINFLGEDEFQTAFKAKLISYRTQKWKCFNQKQFIILKERFQSKYLEIKDHLKKQRKMLNSINLSESRDQQLISFESSHQESPSSKKDSQQSIQTTKQSVKTVLLMLTAKFKENIKKIKPLYEEIVNLTPRLIQKLQSSILKQNAANLQKCLTPSNENYRANQSSFISISSSNSSLQSQVIGGAKQESNEAVMKSILQVAQSIKQQIREIEQLTQNENEFAELLTEFKKEKTSFFECIGTLEIYWTLRFDKVSTFFQQELYQLQKGMDIFFCKLKSHVQKQIETSSETSKKKKSSYDTLHNHEMRISRQISQVSAHNESISETSSQNSNELYYTAKSFQLPRMKISEQISVLEQIPEEEQCKNLNSCQSNMGHQMLSYNDSQQSYLESKNEIDNVQIETNSLSQNEMFSISSNFNIVTKTCDNPQYKSILSNSDSPKNQQKQSNQSRSILVQTQNFQSIRDQREYSKGSAQYKNRKENGNAEKQPKPSNSHQTDSTQSQQKQSDQHEINNIQQGDYFEKKENKKVNDKLVVNFQMCFCVSRHV